MIRDPSDGSVKKRPSVAAMKAKYGDDWGIKPPPEPERKPYCSLTADQLREHYAKHGIGFTVKQTEIDSE